MTIFSYLMILLKILIILPLFGIIGVPEYLIDGSVAVLSVIETVGLILIGLMCLPLGFLTLVPKEIFKDMERRPENEKELEKALKKLYSFQLQARLVISGALEVAIILAGFTYLGYVALTGTVLSLLLIFMMDSLLNKVRG